MAKSAAKARNTLLRSAAVTLLPLAGLSAASEGVPRGPDGFLHSRLDAGSLQERIRANDGGIQMLAVSEARLEEACEQQLPATVPLPQGSCAPRLICLPGQNEPIAMRVCNYGSRTESAPEKETLPAADPHPAIWRWILKE